jgi:hypothetical protein
MAVNLPEPKVILDSIGDGAVELLQTGSRLLDKQAAVIGSYAGSLKSCAEDIKRRTPDDPSVFLDAAVRTAGATIKAIVGTGEAVVGGIDETARGVKSQIERVAR